MIFIHLFSWSYQVCFKCSYSLVKLLWLNIYPNFFSLSFYWVVCFLLLSFSVLSVFQHISIIRHVICKCFTLGYGLSFHSLSSISKVLKDVYELYKVRTYVLALTCMKIVYFDYIHSMFYLC